MDGDDESTGLVLNNGALKCNMVALIGFTTIELLDGNFLSRNGR